MIGESLGAAGTALASWVLRGLVALKSEVAAQGARLDAHQDADSRTERQVEQLFSKVNKVDRRTARMDAKLDTLLNGGNDR